VKGLRVSFCILCCSFLCVFPAGAEEKPVLSVLNFESSGLSGAEVNLVSDIITSHVQKTGAFRVIDRFQRKTIMDEIAFSLSGCVEESCQLEIGRLLSASFIITGSLGSVGSLYVMNLRLIAVETGETVRSETGSFRSIETLMESSQPMIFDLLALEEPTPKEAVTDAAAGEFAPPPEEEPEGHPGADQAAEKPLRHIFGIGAGYITAAVRRESDFSTYFPRFPPISGWYGSHGCTGSGSSFPPGCGVPRRRESRKAETVTRKIILPRIMELFLPLPAVSPLCWEIL